MANLRKINVNGVEHTLGLSDEQLLKLNGIANGAQVNVIEAVKLNGKALTVAADKSVDIVLDNDVFKVLEVLPTAPEAGNENKIHVVPTAGGGEAGNTYSEYIWDGAKWEKLGEFKADVDLSGYVQKETGKGLSTNDYTTAEKAQVAKIATIEGDYVSKQGYIAYSQTEKDKLAGLENYNDSEVRGLIGGNATRIEQVAAGANKATFTVSGDTLTIVTTDVPVKA